MVPWSVTKINGVIRPELPKKEFGSATIPVGVSNPVWRAFGSVNPPGAAPLPAASYDDVRPTAWSATKNGWLGRNAIPQGSTSCAEILLATFARFDVRLVCR